ncbi:hypothetical protein BC936DRAFT_137545, partial [Jimgerdemannia flammicorona]
MTTFATHSHNPRRQQQMSRFNKNQKQKAPNDDSDDDKDNEIFVLYGTEFPEPVKGKVDEGQFQPVWKQEVGPTSRVTCEASLTSRVGADSMAHSQADTRPATSTQWDRRKASDACWAPSTFVSSRGNRTDRKQFKPEDFMDDEDLAELAGEKKLVATEEFDILGGTERELARKRQMAEAANKDGEGYLSTYIPQLSRTKHVPHSPNHVTRRSSLNLFSSSLLSALVTPSKDPIGVRLLRAMGWRTGQGIGARVPRHKRKFDDVDDEEELDDEHAADVTFAPKDSAVVNFVQKTDVFGIGYDPARDRPEIAEMRKLRGRRMAEDDYDEEGGAVDGKAKGKKGGGGFGVGVLEDDLDDLQDDEDAYDGGGGSKRGYHTTLFDEEEEETIILGGRLGRREKELKKRKVGSERDRDRDRDRDLDRDRDRDRGKHGRSGSGQICNDGMPPLKGFVLVKKAMAVEKWYAPPVIPPSFIPVHHFPHPAHQQDPAFAAPKEAFGSAADHRGHLLGETPLPAPTRSVFDYIPTKQKDKLDEFIGGFKGDRRGPLHTPQRQDISVHDVPKIDKPVALAALRGFIPFGDNLKKQTRYKTYLEGQAGLDASEKADAPYAVPKGMTVQDVRKELEEFARAAQIFRPLSTMMASRFTSASVDVIEGGVEGLKPESGLRAGVVPGETKEASEPAKVEEKKSPAAQAAAMNMFGPLTRTTSDFYPNRQLCKHFNVANPHPDHKPSAEDRAGQKAGRTAAGSRDALSKDTVERMFREKDDGFVNAVSQTEVLPGVVPPPSMRGVGASVSEGMVKDPEEVNEVEEEGKEVEFERPSMDIFKAIFAESEDEDEDEGEERESQKEKVENEIATFVKVRRNSLKSIHSDDAELVVGPPPPLPPLSPTSSVAPFKPVFRKRQDREKDDEDEGENEAKSKIDFRIRGKSSPVPIYLGETRAPAFGPVSFSNPFKAEDDEGGKAVRGGGSGLEENSAEGRRKHLKKKEREKDKDKEKKEKDREKKEKRHKDERDHDRDRHKRHSGGRRDGMDDSEDEDKKRNRRKRKENESGSEDGYGKGRHSEKDRDKDGARRKRRENESGSEDEHGKGKHSEKDRDKDGARRKRKEEGNSTAVIEPVWVEKKPAAEDKSTV